MFPRCFGHVGERARFFELVVRFLKSLEELCVPLNWTNDLNLYEFFCLSELFLTNSEPS